MDGIWIRSQDRCKLTFAADIEASGVGVCVNRTENDYFIIGKYATPERALEVTDDIQKHIFNGVHQVYQMPKE